MSDKINEADAIEFACCGDPGCRCETCPEQQRANDIRQRAKRDAE